MKKLFITTILLLIVAVSFAQRPGVRRSQTRNTTTENQAKQQANTTPQAQSVDSKTETSILPQENTTDVGLEADNQAAAPVITNSRDNINIVKRFGQSATPIGHEAHAINGGYAALGRKNPWNVSAPKVSAVANAGSVPMGPGGVTTNFKWNGQTATKFGHEAASVNGYASLGKKNPWEPDVNPMIIPVDPKEALKNADNREIHKLNGQKATKTGHEATAVGSGYASLKTRKD